MNTPTDVLLASSAVSLALLDKLIRRSVITRADGVAIMETAARNCEPLSPVAAQMVRDAKAKMLSGH